MANEILQGFQAGSDLVARGMQIARANRELELEKLKLSQDLGQFQQQQAIKQAQEKRNAEIHNIQMQGITGFDDDTKSGMSPADAWAKHGWKIQYGSGEGGYGSFLGQREKLTPFEPRKVTLDGEVLIETSPGRFEFPPKKKETPTPADPTSAKPITMNGEPTGKALFGDKVIDLPQPKDSNKLTEAQSNALMYADRLKSNDDIISQLEKDGSFKPGLLDNTMPRILNLFRDEAFQKYQSAKHNWISAALRKESGSAIAQSEFDQADRQYFPQPGDSDSVRQQKSELRALVERDMRQAAGGASSGIVEKPKELPKFDSEEAARKAGYKDGDAVLIYNPTKATYTKGVLRP